VPYSHANPSGPSWRAVFGHLKAGRTIIGIDEVGRGAWAGPVVAAAVILKPRAKLPKLDDSKRLSPLARESLNRTIRAKAVAIGIGWVHAPDVDARGLSWAVKESGIRALEALQLPDQDFVVILDGKHNYLSPDYPSEVYVHADAKITPVAAASVIAKVARDHFMSNLDSAHSGYSFGLHKGYGTPGHSRALQTCGVSPVHRTSYAPIRALLDGQSPLGSGPNVSSHSTER
jgi:ribonuclease HII